MGHTALAHSFFIEIGVKLLTNVIESTIPLGLLLQHFCTPKNRNVQE